MDSLANCFPRAWDHTRSYGITRELLHIRARHIHNMFHESVLHPYVVNDDTRFPKRETCVNVNIGTDPEEEWVICSIEDHHWSPGLKFLVHWELGDTSWEPLKVVNELEALDHYLELEGVDSPYKLRRK